mmetsp:Transcript_74361/g.206436  ORF Transcript_74361/g.206436 Transcript_74361/m.206436 type:complete len:86 (+) Transcript_74361:92-349(+)
MAERQDQQMQVGAFATASSPSALFARACARGRGLPLPLVPAGPLAHADVSGANWCDKAWRLSDNIVFLTILAPMAFMGFMNKLPK